MKKKLLVTAIIGAMAVPSAFAAQDTSGMQYTSASEGFYASIRVRYNSGAADEDGAAFENSTSRFGVQGSNDLGGGLEGFYQYEAGVAVDNGGDLSTRIGRVGLRGAFGQIQMGSFWTQQYNWVSGTTDVANVNSGNLNYNQLLPGRVSNAIEYTTPDLSGFQGAILVEMHGDRDGQGAIEASITDRRVIAMDFLADLEDDGIANDSADKLTADEIERNPTDDNDVDTYILAAKYSVQGLDVGASYSVIPDGLAKGLLNADGREDLNTYAVKLGYAQDNWYVNGWYSEDNSSDGLADDDIERFSLAAGVSVDKVNLYGVYETIDDGTAEDDHSAIGVQYNLGARSRVWVEYAGQNIDRDADSTADDYITIGMRHDF